MLAKITSELGKPAGLVVLSREQALERFAGESPGLVPGIGPKTVERLERMGIATLAELRGCASARSSSGLRAALRRLAARPRPVRGRDPGRGLARDQVAVGRDDLRRRRRRPRRDERLARRAGRGALPAAARARARGRTIGIKVRLDDWTNVTRSHTVEAADQRPGAWSARSPSSCCAPTPRRGRCGCSASGSPSSGEAEARRAGADDPEPQLQLGLGASA